MGDLEDRLSMQPLEVFLWPVSYQFRVSTPWGETQQALTIDVPGYYGDLDASKALGAMLWQRTLALASINDVELLSYSTSCWRPGVLELPTIPQPTRGRQIGTPTAREDAGQFVLHTGHMDRWARRRLPLPAMPDHWVSNRVLTPQGWVALRTIAEGWVIGMHTLGMGGPFRQLIAYPGIVPQTVDNFGGVAFRTVTHIRVCEYTDRAPDPSSGL